MKTYPLSILLALSLASTAVSTGAPLAERTAAPVSSSVCVIALGNTDEDCDGILAHKGGTEVLSWSWGASQSGSMSSARHTKTGHVTILKRTDASSAALAARHTSRKSGSIILCDRDGKRVVFHDAVISSISVQGDVETLTVACTLASGDPTPAAPAALKAKEKANRN